MTTPASCKGCGAPLPVGAAKCPYCQAEVPPPDTQVSAALEADLTAFLKTVDEQLTAAKDDDDWLLGAFLVSGVGALVGAWIGLGALEVQGVARWLFTGLLGISLFCAFGVIVGRNEARAVARCYRTRSRDQIERFLMAKRIRRVDLDTYAAKTLAPDSRLRKFLFEE